MGLLFFVHYLSANQLIDRYLSIIAPIVYKLLMKKDLQCLRCYSDLLFKLKRHL